VWLESARTGALGRKEGRLPGCQPCSHSGHAGRVGAGHGRMAFLETIEQRDATARQLQERHGQAKQGVKAEAATAAAL
ncbi:hypothetical protein HaLaN_09386, partial [Haematococcus lacustris]